MTDVKPSESKGSASTGRAARAVFVLAATVCLAFAIVVGAYLLRSYLSGMPVDPQEDAQYASLKQQLATQPTSEALREQIRQKDLALREEHFRVQQFRRVGTWLLLAGLAGVVTFANLAALAGRGAPRPVPQDAQAATRSPWPARLTVGLVGLIVGVGAGLLAIHGAWNMPEESIAAAMRQEMSVAQTDGAGDGQTPDANPANPTSGFTGPSEEQLKANWPQFRGYQGSGIYTGPAVPETWNVDEGTNILWTAKIPIQGMNSPVIWDDKVIFSGADEKNRAVLCYSATDGKLLWQTAIETEKGKTLPASGGEGAGYSAPTMATDGRYACAIFANGDLACLDMEGKVVWATNLGPFVDHYGHSSSLAIWKDTLIVQADQGPDDDGNSQSRLIGYNLADGRVVWQTKRDIGISWASPIVIDTSKGPQIITITDPWVFANEPVRGRLIWKADVMVGEVAPSPIYVNGLVIASMDGAATVAIDPTGTGDVSETHVKWENDFDLPATCTPVSDGTYVWTLTDDGWLACLDMANGKMVWEEELMMDFQASPIIANGKLWLFSTDGTVLIVKPGKEFDKTAELTVPDGMYATPVPHKGKLYVRLYDKLICIGAKK